LISLLKKTNRSTLLDTFLDSVNRPNIPYLAVLNCMMRDYASFG
jgi:hypothetical protein